MKNDPSPNNSGFFAVQREAAPTNEGPPVVGYFAIVAQMIADLRNDLERHDLISRDMAADRLLTAIGEALGTNHFTTGQVIAHGQAIDDPQLSAAIAAVVGSDGSPARRLGKYLAGIADRPLGGLVVTAEGTEAGGNLWTVRPAQRSPGG